MRYRDDMDTNTAAERRTVDVTELSDDDIKAVENIVAHLRRAAGALHVRPPHPTVLSRPRPSDEEFERRLDQMAARHRPGEKSLPTDFARADIYPDDE